MIMAQSHSMKYQLDMLNTWARSVHNHHHNRIHNVFRTQRLFWNMKLEWLRHCLVQSTWDTWPLRIVWIWLDDQMNKGYYWEFLNQIKAIFNRDCFHGQSSGLTNVETKKNSWPKAKILNVYRMSNTYVYSREQFLATFHQVGKPRIGFRPRDCGQLHSRMYTQCCAWYLNDRLYRLSGRWCHGKELPALGSKFLRNKLSDQ